MPDGVMTENRRGEWVPSIPEPFFERNAVRCGDCEERFRGKKDLQRRRYREHFALVHILGLD